MATPEDKAYGAIKAELAADDAHPMAGTIVDEYIATKHAYGEEAALEVFANAASAARETIAIWRQQAAEAAGRAK